MQPKKKNAIATILNLKETVEYVQNLMADILNYIETFKNLFLWVTPGKVSLYQFIYVCCYTKYLISLRIYCSNLVNYIFLVKS